MFNSRVVLLVGLPLAAVALTSCSSSGTPSTDMPEPATSQPASNAQPYTFDGSGANVEKAMFGKDWPLTVPAGRVNCVKRPDGNVEVIFTTDNGKRYALNGIARSGGDWLEVEEIWANNPQISGAKKDIGVLIDVCQPLMP